MTEKQTQNTTFKFVLSSAKTSYKKTGRIVKIWYEFSNQKYIADWPQSATRHKFVVYLCGNHTKACRTITFPVRNHSAEEISTKLGIFKARASCLGTTVLAAGVCLAASTVCYNEKASRVGRWQINALPAASGRSGVPLEPAWADG